MESMLGRKFEPQFPVKLLEKDLAYAVTTAGGDASTPTISSRVIP
jgi:3-hydroxyisobutyrate dehydrogenase-like beta-hydroxyacid dehydrogenase